MIDVYNHKCKTKECYTFFTENKYKDYCVRCFIHTFPDEKVSKNYMIKENNVKEFLEEYFKDQNIIHNKPIAGGCSKKRPDFFIDLLTHCIIIEVDEDQHPYYTCENKRMMLLFTDLGDRPIIFIRFNPDGYTINGIKYPSCFSYHKALGVPIIKHKKNWNERLNLLKETIIKHIMNIPEKEVTIESLFFNSA